MIRKQVVHIVSEAFNYFFNWDKSMVDHVFLSGMLILLFGRSLVMAGVNFLLYAVSTFKETIQRYKEHNNGHRIMPFHILSRHRHI